VGQFEASLGKKVSKIPLSINRPDMVVHTDNSSYAGGIHRRMSVQGVPGQKHKSLSEK
jgi:hypothetical protein